MQRRQFLGAAAAAANLPVPSAGPNPANETPLKDEYRELDRGEMSAGGWFDLFGDDDAEVEVIVTSIPKYEDGERSPLISLRLSTSHADIGTFLRPDEAAQVAEALRRGTTRRFRSQVDR